VFSLDEDRSLRGPCTVKCAKFFEMRTAVCEDLGPLSVPSSLIVVQSDFKRRVVQSDFKRRNSKV